MSWVSQDWGTGQHIFAFEIVQVFSVIKNAQKCCLFQQIFMPNSGFRKNAFIHTRLQTICRESNNICRLLKTWPCLSRMVSERIFSLHSMHKDFSQYCCRRGRSRYNCTFESNSLDRRFKCSSHCWPETIGSCLISFSKDENNLNRILMNLIRPSRIEKRSRRW